METTPTTNTDNLTSNLPLPRRQVIKLGLVTGLSTALAYKTHQLDRIIGPITTLSQESLIVAKNLPKLIKDYVTIIKSNDPNKEQKRKDKEASIFNWIMAQAASLRFKSMGYPFAGKMMTSYLLASGKPVDVSSDLSRMQITGDNPSLQIKHDLDRSEMPSFDDFFGTILPGLLATNDKSVLTTKWDSDKPDDIMYNVVYDESGKPYSFRSNVYAKPNTTPDTIKQVILNTLRGPIQTGVFGGFTHGDEIEKALGRSTYTLTGNPNVADDMIDVEEIEIDSKKVYKVSMSPKAVQSIRAEDYYNFDHEEREVTVVDYEIIKTIEQITNVFPLDTEAKESVTVLLNNIAFQGLNWEIDQGLITANYDRQKRDEIRKSKDPLAPLIVYKWLHHKGLSKLETDGLAKSFPIKATVEPKNLPNAKTEKIVFFIQQEP